MTGTIDAAIFDLDGVLLDTEPLYSRATEVILARHGKTYSSELKRFVMGRSPIDAARWVVGQLNLPMSPEAYVLERVLVLKELLLDCPAVPGAAQLVRALHVRGLRLAVATSSEQQLFEVKTKKHPWFGCFQCTICGDDPRLSQLKPAPDIFLLAARTLGISPERCLVFEDSPAGVAAARAAAMRVVGRLDAPLVPSDLQGAEPIVTGYHELDIERLIST
jgi:pseudouridine-5'-monophosphatase